MNALARVEEYALVGTASHRTFHWVKQVRGFLQGVRALNCSHTFKVVMTGGSCSLDVIDVGEIGRFQQALDEWNNRTWMFRTCSTYTLRDQNSTTVINLKEVLFAHLVKKTQ